MLRPQIIARAFICLYCKIASAYLQDRRLFEQAFRKNFCSLKLVIRNVVNMLLQTIHIEFFGENQKIEIGTNKTFHFSLVSDGM